MTDKYCRNCKFDSVMADHHPCSDCVRIPAGGEDNWKPKDNKQEE